jgi:hypothetical protein
MGSRLLAEKSKKGAKRSGGKGNNIQAVTTAIDVMNSVSSIGRPALLREIAAKCGLTASRTHRYLVSSAKQGFLSKRIAAGVTTLAQ